MVAYDYDGNDVVMSVTSDRAKWKNASRQPKVALLVPEGRRHLSCTERPRLRRPTPHASRAQSAFVPA